jgi:acetyltransferase-like isoleucine patch superfamily enzyme
VNQNERSDDGFSRICFNCIVLDVCDVRIGDHTLVGPGVQILTPLHPFDAELRRTQEFGRPVDVGSDVWVGGGALILAGRQPLPGHQEIRRGGA